MSNLPSDSNARIDSNASIPPTQEQHVDLKRRQTLGALGALSVIGATGLIGCGGGSSGSNSASTSSATLTSSSASSNAALTSSSASSAALTSSSASSAALTSSSISSSSTATTASSSTALSSSAASSSGVCTLIPTETIGPFPLSTLLDNSLVLRENIAEDKTGVPLQVKIKLVNVNNGCKPVSGYVYIWHCDKDGLYSGYSANNNAGQAGKTYCRGVQYTDSNGVASFTTIYPGWYAGRITHIHFQIFLTNYGSTASSTAISQMAFPAATTTAVYETPLYTKGQNTSVTSFSADNVFSDGVEYQLATITGNVTDGLIAELEVGIAV